MSPFKRDSGAVMGRVGMARGLRPPARQPTLWRSALTAAAAPVKERERTGTESEQGVGGRFGHNFESVGLHWTLQAAVTCLHVESVGASCGESPVVVDVTRSDAEAVGSNLASGG